MSQTAQKPRRALITGGASGFGLGVARAMLDQGASVAIADQHAGRLQEAAQALDAGERLLPLELDVTSSDSVRAAVAACETAFGGLDTLVNSAGVIRMTPLDDISEEEWDWVVGVDLKGVFLCSQAAAPLLRQSGRGRIVNLSSDAGKVGFPTITPYVAAKHGVIGLTKSLAAELAPSKVTVNCLCPVGTPETSMGQDVLQMKARGTGASEEQLMAAAAANVPLGRSCTVADVVHAVMFLLSDEAAFLTGGTIDVDGGLINTAPVRGTAS
ncbi:MAG: short-chain dehydrogenase [Dehalococcoidia bacterium]|nr:short-chain dehydrogenase [Dehalococcoidia bacterium]